MVSRLLPALFLATTALLRADDDIGPPPIDQPDAPVVHVEVPTPSPIAPAPRTVQTLVPIDDPVMSIPVGTHTMEEVNPKPKAIFVTPLIYPPSLRFKHYQGQVLIAFVVKADGTVGYVHVAKAMDQTFADAAAQTVKQWRFSPGMIGNKPVATVVEVPLVYGRYTVHDPEYSGNLADSSQNGGGASGSPAPAPLPTTAGSASVTPFDAHTIPVPDGAHVFSTLTVKPRAVVQVRPVYPPDLRKAGIEGQATIAFVVRADGTVTVIGALNGTDRRFAEAASAAIAQWRFAPGLMDSFAVDTFMEVPVVFHLDDLPDDKNAPARGTVGPVNRPLPPLPKDVYAFGPGITPPRPTFQARPRYPAALRKAGDPGSASVLFIVGKNGTVTDAFALQATDGRFGYEAVQAVLQWRFTPATKDGKPVAVRLEVPLYFTIN